MARNREQYNAYMRDYILKRYHRRMTEARTFLGGKCVECGSSNNLQLDHIDRKTKEGTVANIWSYSKEKFWKEVKKCQLLCQPCHIVKGRKFGDVMPATTHGKSTMYDYHRCRCDICVRGKCMRLKNWRERTGRK